MAWSSLNTITWQRPNPMPSDPGTLDAFKIIDQITLQTTMDELMNRVPPLDDDGYYERLIALERRDRAMWQSKQDAKQAKKEGVEDDA